MKTLKDKAKAYFGHNPGTTVLFGTSDGTLFLQKQHAAEHAKSLDNQELSTFTATSKEPQAESTLSTESTESTLSKKPTPPKKAK